MNQPIASPSATAPPSSPVRIAVNWESVGVAYARLALGAAFLSAVASRFGLWDRTFDLKHFAGFLEYAGEVLAFMPRASVPYLATAATICETFLGILLISGLWQRWVAMASAVLLAMFATAMAISLGVKSPMDYSVYSASGAAVLLALHSCRKEQPLEQERERCNHD